ncbi:MAG: hypothetical protein HY737_00135 [Candidatus Omnitrophica bacterium]|nr:hypothetical protein [Candidatus Omnitrophota bacterium]
MVKLSRSSDRSITLFVILWLLVFFYETFRLHYLSPLLGRELPKLNFLFPPAGWIMFYNVDAGYGFAQVYGVKDNTPTELDPHQIFRTKAVGYDNLRRNVLIEVLSPHHATNFCRYLRWKFPAYDDFAVVEAGYPDVIRAPTQVGGRVAYTCGTRSPLETPG